LFKKIDALLLRLEQLEIEKEQISIDLDTAQIKLKSREDAIQARDEVLFLKNPSERIQSSWNCDKSHSKMCFYSI
jgi:hypothetical protein